MTTIVRRRKLGITSCKGIVAASKQGISYANNYQHIPDDDVYIRWGCTSNLPNKRAEVINSANAIHLMADKSGFRKLLNERGLCPKTWFSPYDFLLGQEPSWPLIVRTKTHAQGRGMWVCKNWEELGPAVGKAGPGYYINEFIPKVAEYRVFVMQGYVVWVAEKTPSNPNDVAWNVAKGGRFDNVRWGAWNMNVIRVALRAWELTQSHFAGLDIMLDRDGKAYCLEANSAPSQTSPYRQSCVAKAFDYMIEKGIYDRCMGPRPVIDTWKDVIHPSLLT